MGGRVIIGIWGAISRVRKEGGIIARVDAKIIGVTIDVWKFLVEALTYWWWWRC